MAGEGKDSESCTLCHGRGCDSDCQPLCSRCLVAVRECACACVINRKPQVCPGGKLSHRYLLLCPFTFESATKFMAEFGNYVFFQMTIINHFKKKKRVTACMLVHETFQWPPEINLNSYLMP